MNDLETDDFLDLMIVRGRQSLRVHRAVIYSQSTFLHAQTLVRLVESSSLNVILIDLAPLGVHERGGTTTKTRSRVCSAAGVILSRGSYKAFDEYKVC